MPHLSDGGSQCVVDIDKLIVPVVCVVVEERSVLNLLRGVAPLHLKERNITINYGIKNYIELETRWHSRKQLRTYEHTLIKTETAIFM